MTLDVKTDYVSSPQAARVLRITSVGVAQLARQGKIPAVKIANRWLIPRAFVSEFARTYQGKRGRPRKNRRPVSGYPTTQAAPQPPMAEPGATADVGLPRQETGGILAVSAWIANIEETQAIAAPDTAATPAESTGAAGAGESGPAVEAVSAIKAPSDKGDSIPAAAPASDASSPGPDSRKPPDHIDPAGQPDAMDLAAPSPTEAEPVGSVATSEAAGATGAADSSFSIGAEVYHLDKNYDFEVYEKGQITEKARLVIARLKPKIPSLPHFSFRWDYRYQHLNVDIHGVEPAVADWWTMGENGYTGHLPRRLAGPGYAFEAIIWLPVTFVFRGRLTLSLRDTPEAEEDQQSVATTTGGIRRLWTKWAPFSSK